ncbi:MAG TPA: hypothetical protein VJC17_01080, partial [Candidatus Dojkabacteria bacterium]|nr:hypothetical protein [Candidatus Dojkabacteria bacterium]
MKKINKRPGILILFLLGFITFTVLWATVSKILASGNIIVSGGITDANVSFGGMQRRVVFVNGNWYAFYTSAGQVLYRKSPDGIVWSADVNIETSDSNNYNPSIWRKGDLIYAAWVDSGDETLEFRTIDTANSDNLGSLCASPAAPPTPQPIDANFMTSIAVTDDNTVYASYSDTSDPGMTTQGDHPVAIYKINYGACTFADINSGALYDQDRPVLITTGNTLHMVFSDFAWLVYSQYNGAAWTFDYELIAVVDDNTYSVTTDGTNLYVMSFVENKGLSYTADLGNNEIHPPPGGNHFYKFNGTTWSTVATPYDDFSSPPSVLSDQVWRSYVTVVGNDNLARIINYRFPDDELEYFQCTNVSCSTYNRTAFPIAPLVWQHSGDMAIGPDGYARILYVPTSDHALHLIR